MKKVISMNLVGYNDRQVEAILKTDGPILVIAGAGAGEFSQKFKDVIKTISIPVVISSRIDGGIILTDNLLVFKLIFTDFDIFFLSSLIFAFIIF